MNPPEHNWNTGTYDLKLDSLRERWEKVAEIEGAYSDPSLTKESLNDDYQLLFVNLLLQHMEDIVAAWNTQTVPKPMYLLLLGTAGTGKTRTVQTCLQELRTRLRLSLIHI